MADRERQSWRARLWSGLAGVAGDVDAVRSVDPLERSPWSEARLLRAEWPQRPGWSFTICTGLAPTVGTIVGALLAQDGAWSSGAQIAAAVLGFLLGLLVLWMVSLVVFAIQAPAQGLRSAKTQLAAVNRRLVEYEADAPELSFGRAQMEKHSQHFSLGLPETGHPQYQPYGRVVRVPVINAHGAGTALAVQVLLTILPDDKEGAFSPRDPVLAEWDSDYPTTTKIDLPGNGQPHLFDVVLVTEKKYPNIYEWSRRSKAAALQGFAIASSLVEIEIEVRGSGPGKAAPMLRDTLKVEERGSILVADWASANFNDEGTNYVRWSPRNW